MTDDTERLLRIPDAPEARTADFSQAEAYDREHRDWVLQHFIGICNLSGLEIPVTLNLGGTFVSGHIVRPQVYFEGLIADLQSATFHGQPASQAANASKQLLEQTISNMRVGMDEILSDNPEPWSDPGSYQPRYIHLRGARFFAPDEVGRALRGNKKIWWRGKVESVDGFYFGMPFAD